MEVILLEKIKNFGNVGAKVKVSCGFGRNYLIPEGKAVYATKKNLEEFEKKREEFEKKAQDVLIDAQKRFKTLNNLLVNITVKVSEEEKMFGSIGIRDIVLALKNLGHEIQKKEVSLPNGAIRQVGEYDVNLLLHSDVIATIKLKIIGDKNKDGV